VPQSSSETWGPGFVDGVRMYVAPVPLGAGQRLYGQTFELERPSVSESPSATAYNRCGGAFQRVRAGCIASWRRGWRGGGGLSSCLATRRVTGPGHDDPATAALVRSGFFASGGRLEHPATRLDGGDAGIQLLLDASVIL
jgi:hypothetical protein